MALENHFQQENTIKKLKKCPHARANRRRLWYPKTMNKAITLLLTIFLLMPALSSAQDRCNDFVPGFCQMTLAQRRAFVRRWNAQRRRESRRSAEQARREACQDYAYYCVETERWSESRCRRILSSCTDGW